MTVLLVAGAAACSRASEPARVTLRPPDEIEFPARVNARSFESSWVMPGYHAVVWKGGRMAHFALLQADVTDRQIIRALEELGARPGNNLSMEAWTERKDPRNPAADEVIRGSGIEVLVRLPGGGTPISLSSVLLDSGGRGVEMHYGGNEDNISKWRSGCIVCLYSCPGSKVGNARYTERDYARKATRFRVRPGILPKDGTAVRVVLRLTRPR